MNTTDMKSQDKMSTGLEIEKSYETLPTYDPTAAHKEAMNFYIERLNRAKTQRSLPYEEFDDMDFYNDYVQNRRALISYLRKKKNDADVRVNTGITEKRIETVVLEILGMNLQTEFRAFDQNDRELRDLGNEFTDIVRRTNEIEQQDDQMVDIMYELMSQRAVFVQEVLVSRKSGNSTVKRFEKRLLSGLQVYLGDITLPAYRFNEQPYILIYERMDISKAKSIYGSLPNFQFVKPGNTTSTESGPLEFEYRFGKVKGNEVEVIHYMSAPDNEYNVIINGVLMYEPGTKLPWGWEGYNTTMVVLKPIHGKFAYGKPLTASTKFLQALNNETIRNLVRKFRQAIEPPMGVKSGRIYSKNIWDPGIVTQGLKADDFEILINHQGVTQSEMNMYSLIEQKTNEFIGGGTLQSQDIGSRATAAEILERKRETVKALGMCVLSAMRLVRNCDFLRLYDVLENGTKVTGKKYNNFTKKIENVYQTFSVSDTMLEDGTKGKKMITFADKDLLPEEEFDLYAFEQQLKNSGENMRVRIINKPKMESIRLNWFGSVVNKERDSSELSKAMFTEKLNQAVGIMNATQRPINSDTVIDEYEKTYQVKNMFQKEAPVQQIQPGMEVMEGMMGGAEAPAPVKGAATDGSRKVNLAAMKNAGNQQVM